MNAEYYDDLSRTMGYGDQEKERLWGQCPPDERLKIISLLLSLREVRKICDFEDDFTCGRDEYEVEYARCAQEWAAMKSLDEIPVTLAPFTFFSFNGEKFVAEVLQNEVERFFWHPQGTYVNKS